MRKGLRERMCSLPAFREVTHGAERYAFVAVQMLDEPLEHQHAVPARDHLRVHGENEHTTAHLAVEVLEISGPDVVHPDRVCQPRTDSVAAGGICKERKVI